jgi:hypothetical protein
MPSQQSRRNTGAWRSRREEYLRASGRESDLVKEGFEPAAATPSWAVIAGGRPSHLPKPNLKAGLFLVKKARS